MNIKVEWTGHYPCLCYGHWVLMIDGEDKSDLIPSAMNGLSETSIGLTIFLLTDVFKNSYFMNFKQVIGDMEAVVGVFKKIKFSS